MMTKPRKLATKSIKIPHKEKNNGGRKAFYENVEDLQKQIDEYFSSICADEVVLDENHKPVVDTKGRPVIHYNPPTLSGLALFLGFMDRQSLYDYRDRKGKKEEGFACTIKRAISRIEEYAEKQLYIGNSTGAIFWLKNKGWKDKSEVESTTLTINREASEEELEWMKESAKKVFNLKDKE